jgi:serine/threonine protein phosphatase PrpC
VSKCFTTLCHSLNSMVKKNPYIDTKLSGSTGVMVLVKDNHLHCANVGDSRAILIRGSNYVIELSTDQKPSDPIEKQRIIANGGRVHPCRSSTCSSVPSGKYVGPPRVWNKTSEVPGLMMSRSFGDEIGHACGIICTPVVKTFPLDKDCSTLVVATDGLWEMLGYGMINSICRNHLQAKDASAAAKELCLKAQQAWQKVAAR